MWFHPAKELKGYCTINPRKANNLKGFKPLGARILWSMVGASILAPAGAGISLPSLLPAASWVCGIPSLSLLLSSLQTFSTFSLHPVHHCFHWEPPGSSPWIWGCSVLWEHGSFLKSQCGSVGPHQHCCCCPWDWRSCGTWCFRQ